MVQIFKPKSDSASSSQPSQSALDAIPLIKADEFLPSISRWITFSGYFLVGAIGCTIALAAVTRYNVAVKADATVRPDGDLRVVQTELEGTIKQIEVTENQTVRQGDIVAYLDDTKLQIQKNQLQASVQQGQLQLDQFDAQIRLLNAQIAAENRSIDGSIAAAEAETRRNQRELEERQVTTQADFEEAEASLAYAREERDRYERLVSVGAVSDLQLREKETALRGAEARLERARAALNPTTASVNAAQEQVTQQVARGQATIAELRKERESLIQRRSEAQTQLIRDQTQLEQTERDLEGTIIRATTTGTVLKLNLSNPNQIVRAGDSIAQIAPHDAPLVIKASVANQDIDKVEVGQLARVRVNACPYPDYGVLQGNVIAVAPDVASQENQSTDSTSSQNSSSNSNSRSFEVIIQPDRPALVRHNRECQIQAGMEASATIVSREETFLQFVLRKARIWTDL
jgi:HlyD family secretion protein